MHFPNLYATYIEWAMTHLTRLLTYLKAMIFLSPPVTNPNIQFDISWELFLICFGLHGRDASWMAKVVGISEGSVYDYSRSVSRALHEIGPKVICWGGDEARQKTADYVLHHFGLPDCIGIVDGSLIRLKETPHLGPVYYSRKKFPAVRFLFTFL